MRSGKPEALGTAYHEIGHVILSHVVAEGRHAAFFVTIEPTSGPARGQELGRTDLRRGLPRRRTRRNLDSYATVLAAGAVAERLAGFEPNDFHDQDGLGGVFRPRSGIAAGAPWTDQEIASFERWLALIEARAECQLRACWDRVEGLAALLLQRGTLRGREIRGALSRRAA